jgi:hypothetical protein
MNFTKLFFGDSPASDHTGNGKPVTDDASVVLGVSKAVRQLEIIAAAYGLTVLDGAIGDLQADLFQMIRHQDLTNLRFELLGRDGRIAFEFKVEFDADKSAGGKAAESGGIEIPVLRRDLIAGRRLVVNRKGADGDYKHLLKLPWGTAKVIPKNQGSAYASAHASKITGGRQAASFHVSDAARHRFVITQTGKKGFAFAKDLVTNRDGIFLLVKDWPDDASELRIGTVFTGLLISVPKGLQIRNPRPA